MPIGIDQFDDTPEDALDIQEGTQPYRVLRFLAAHDDQAFTQTEIAEDDRLASYAAQTESSSASTTDDYYGETE